MTALTRSYMTGEGGGQLLYETIGECFDRMVDANPDGLAVVVRHQNIRWSWSEFRRNVDRLQNAGRTNVTASGQRGLARRQRQAGVGSR